MARAEIICGRAILGLGLVDLAFLNEDCASNVCVVRFEVRWSEVRRSRAPVLNNLNLRLNSLCRISDFLRERYHDS